MGQNTSTPYDDVFKTLLNDCTKLIIPVINEIFGENYSGDETITDSRNEHFIHITDTTTKEKITDSCFTIHGTVDKKYHIECQSTSDGSMIVRMFEYDSQIALAHGDIDNHVLTITFPHSAVLYLRHTSATPDFMTVKIKTPGTHAEYQMPIMKIQRYAIDEIFEKNLLFLIPFHIFCYEKRAIINLSEKVIENLAKKHEKIKKGVTSIMGGQIIDYEAKDILRKGIQQGEVIGRQQGKLLAFIDLIKDGLLSISEAAKRLNMEESELEKYL